MAESFIQLPPNSSGTQMEVRTEATNGYARQVVVVADPSVTDGIAPVDGVKGLVVQQYQGLPINQFGSVSVPSSTETTLVTYIVPMTKTLLIKQVVAWGDYDAEFFIRVDGTQVGGGRSSPSDRTLVLSYAAPIMANAGQTVTVAAMQYAPSAQTMNSNLVGELQ